MLRGKRNKASGGLLLMSIWDNKDPNMQYILLCRLQLQRSLGMKVNTPFQSNLEKAVDLQSSWFHILLFPAKTTSITIVRV